MNAVDLIKYLNERQIYPYLDAGKLKTRSVSPTLDADVVTLIRTHKDALIACLQQSEASDSGRPVLTRRPTDRHGVELSYGQRALWFIDQLEGSAQYHIPLVVRISGTLDSAALQDAFDAIVERHHVLRTVYGEHEGEPVARLNPARSVPIETVHVPTTDASLDNPDIARRISAFIRKPFDLRKDLMLRVLLVHCAPDLQILVHVSHHIASDGWSNAVLMREFEQFYRKAAGGEPYSSLEPLDLQYADFSAWQRECLSGDRLAQSLSYWRSQLEDLPVLHGLPTDFARPRQQDYRAEYHSHLLDRATVAELKRLGVAHRATLFMVLEALLSAVVARWSNEDDIVLAVPNGGRHDPRLESLVGYFINTLVLRNHVNLDGGFSQLLDSVRETTQSAFAHGDVPLELLVEDLKPPRSLAHNPLAQIKLVLQNQQRGSVDVAGLHLEPLSLRDKQIRFDLDLTATETEDGLRLTWSYQTALFRSETIAALAKSFEILAHSVVAQPESAVGSFSLSDPTETAAICGDLRDRPFTSLTAVLQDRVDSPSVAVRTPTNEMSYADLTRRVARLMAYLEEMGVARGDVVGVALEPDASVLVALYAVLGLGAAYVPVAQTAGSGRCAEIFADAQVDVILTTSTMIENLKIGGLDLILLDAVHDPTWLEEYDTPYTTVQVSPTDLAYVLYTSGSTGKPKGVEVSHGALMDYLCSAREVYGDGCPGTLLITSFAFDMAVPSLFLPVFNGGCVWAHGDRQALDYAAEVLADPATPSLVLRMTPSHANALADLLPEAVGAQHVMVIGGEAFPPELRGHISRFAPNARVFNHYGPTEAVVGCSTMEVEVDVEDAASVPIGRPLPNTVLYVVDANGVPVPQGMPGELLIGGTSLADGYLRNPQATRERFVPNALDTGLCPTLYRSGDRVRLRHDGQLEYLGRLDEQVKIRGYRVEPAEVEKRVLQCDGVRDVRVVATPQGRETILSAYVILDDASRTAESIARELSTMLPEYMVPTVFIPVDEWPLTANGKLDVRGLPAVSADNRERLAPRTDLQRRLCSIWQSILNISSVGIRDDFFALGGHSLIATRVISAIARETHQRISVRTLFENPTVEALAVVLETDAPSDKSVVASVDRSRPLVLSRAQERLWFLQKLDPDSTHYNLSTALRLLGELNVPALQRSIEDVVECHEILRTVYVDEAGKSHQVVLESFNVPWQEVDVGAGNSRKDLSELIRSEAAQAFDLTQQLPLRCVLYRESNHQNVLQLTCHHIAFDGWSRGVFIRQLSRAYENRCAGSNPELVPPAVQYADFAGWQADRLLSSEQAHVDYWLDQLEDAPALHSVPTDFPRPAQQSFDGDQVRARLSSHQLDALNGIAAARGTTLFSLLEAVFALLIGRWSYSDDLLIGTPVSGRDMVDVDDSIGCFVNTVVLRHALQPGQTFSEFLDDVTKTAVDALSHSEVPFESLVDALQPRRSLAHTPVFQLLFTLRARTEDRLTLSDLVLEPVATEHHVAKFDLELVATETEESVELSWLFATSLFERGSIVRMAHAFERMVATIIDNPSIGIYQIPLMSPEKAQHYLRPGMVRPYGEEATLAHAVEIALRQYPTIVAAEDSESGSQMTYLDLEQRSNAVMHQVTEAGISPCERVGIFMERGIDTLVVLTALVRMGVVYVPLDPHQPAARLQFIAEDCRLKAIFAEAGAVVPVANVPVWPVYEDRFEAPPRVVCPSPDSVAAVLYTSGSTGEPKGVQITQRNVVRLVHEPDYTSISPGSVVTHASNLAFDAATVEVWLALANGATSLIIDRDLWLEPERVRSLVRRRTVDFLFITTALFNQLARTAPDCLAGVRQIVFGGEAVDPESVAMVMAKSQPERLTHAYGPTENGTYSTTWVIHHAAAVIPIGRAVNGSYHYVVDLGGSLVPPGARGELLAGGDGLSPGYLNRPQLTDSSFIEDPFQPHARVYRTGDLVRLLPDDNLVFSGRIDNQVKIRGFRIEPEEVTAALLRRSDVAEAIVLAVGDDGCKRLAAWCVRSDGEPDLVWTQNLRQELAADLPAYMVPSAIMGLRSMPLTSNGKIDRKRLPPLTLEVGSAEPQTETQRRLCEIWQQVLGLKSLGIDDNFFEVGGDSILSIQVVSRAAAMGIGLTTRDLFEYQTVRGLAGVARSLSMPAEQTTVTGTHALLPLQRRFLTGDVVDAHHFNQSVLLRPNQQFSKEALLKAVGAVLDRHDGLRQVLREGCVHYLPLDDPEFFVVEEVVMQSGTAGVTTSGGAVTAACERWQEAFDLESGPLIRFVLMHLEAGGQRLFVVAHHLVIDAVSWRILLPDLALALEQAINGEMPQLAPKTVSLKSWIEAFWKQAKEQRFDTEFWHTQSAGVIPRLHPEKTVEASVSTQTSLSVAIGRNLTQYLIRSAVRELRSSLEELLLSAVSSAICRWQSCGGFVLELENHGRSDRLGLDVTQTVGWFTVAYPVVVRANEDTCAQRLRHIKAAVRSVPQDGLGYGVEETLAQIEPDVTFNFLGHFDQTLSGQGLLEIADEAKGKSVSPRRPQRARLGVRGKVSSGCLSLALDYSEQQYTSASIEQLGELIEEELEQLRALAENASTDAVSVHDFDLVTLEEATLTRVLEICPDVEDVLPVSPLQSGMWYHSTRDVTAYVVQAFPQLSGRLDGGRLRAALESVVARHTALRAFFVTDSKGTYQCIAPAGPIAWEFHDWSDRNERQQEAAFSELRATQQARGFLPGERALMRFDLAQFSPDRFQLLWTYHHSLIDGWCVPIIYGEVMQAYDALSSGLPEELAVPGDYRQYSRWLNERDRAAAHAYWSRYLSGFEQATELPGEDRKCEVTDQSAAVSLQIDGKQLVALRELAESTGVTLSTLAQFAWATTLSRLADSDDIVFGATISGRPEQLPNVDRLVGCFINTIPVRYRSQSDTLGEALMSLQQDFLTSTEHGYLSLTDVAAASDVRDSALFHSLLVFENFPKAVDGGAAPSSVRMTGGGSYSDSNYPLTLVAGVGDELRMRLQFDTGRWSQDAAAQILETVRSVLTEIVANPAQRTDQLALRSMQQQRQIQSLHDARVTDDEPWSLVEAVCRQIEDSPDAPCIEFDDAQWTYRQLDRQADVISSLLRKADVRAGNVVAVCVPQSARLISCMWAIIRSGCTYVNLDPANPLQRNEEIIGDSRAQCVIGVSSTALNLPDTVSAVFVDAIDTETDAAQTLPRNASADAPAYIVYTSGSTGKPKGVPVLQRNVRGLIESPNYLPPGERSVRIAQASNSSFDAIAFEVWYCLVHGGCLVGMPHAVYTRSDAMGRWLRDGQIDVLFVTTAVFNAVAGTAPDAFASLKALLFGGEQVNIDAVQRVFRAGAPETLLHMYGPTECSTFSTFCPLDGVADRLCPIGLPTSGSCVLVLDSHGRPVPPGGSGELLIGGQGVVDGYLRRPELTEERFIRRAYLDGVAEKFYRTGDRVRVLADGNLLFLGRFDDQVKLRGFRVEPGEIQAQLDSMAFVKSSAVVVQEYNGVRQLVAFICVDEGAVMEWDPCDEAEQRLRRRLPPFMIPSKILQLESIPMTERGKIDRRSLPNALEAALAEAFTAPSTHTEEVLAGIWSQLLDLAEVSVTANFFHIGGHSLLLTRALAATTEALQCELTIEDFFRHPTIVELAEFIDTLLRSGGPETDAVAEEVEQIEW